MYKLMIVDDEAIIRNGIINNMDFKAMGIEVVASCENGLEALDLVKQQQPDIIMTDINMPFMNGLDLAEQVLELLPLTKIIFLTGYDTFEYAQQALKLKIVEYLVKPILPKELSKVFTKVIHLIREEEAESESLSKMKERLAETVPVLRERFLNRLIKRPIMTDELQGKMESLGIKLQARYFQLMIVDAKMDDVENADYNRMDMALTKMLGIVHSYIEVFSDAISFRTYFDQIVIIVGGDDNEDLREASDLLAEKIDVVAHKNLEINVTIGIGKTVRHLERISKSFEGAAEALEYKLFGGESHVVSCYDIAHKRGNEGLTIVAYAARMHKEIKSGNLDSINGLLGEVFGILAVSQLSTTNYYIHVQSIVTSIILSLEEQGIHYADIFTDKKNPNIKLYEMVTLDEMYHWLRDMCANIMAYIREEREDYQTSQAKSAVDYIAEHYGDEDISLKKICKDLCMSVSYFSVLFKEETGTTFVDYLTKIRIDKAKELLRNTSHKTYVIAATVGYKDPHYFSLVFKKATGMTATAFRDSLKGV